jgi:putative phosphoesterase
MRIGLIADTHIPGSLRELWPQVFRAFDGVEAILHAGDLHTLGVVDQLHEVAPTYVARGNGDRGLEDERLRDAWLLEFKGVRVGMIHEFPKPGRRPDHYIAEHIQRVFDGHAPQVVVYGHTHWESIDYVDQVLCVNPGSPTLPRNRSMRLGTIGFIEIDEGTPRASLFQLTDHGIEPHDHTL